MKNDDDNPKCKLRTHKTIRMTSTMAHTLDAHARTRDLTSSELIRKLLNESIDRILRD